MTLEVIELNKPNLTLIAERLIVLADKQRAKPKKGTSNNGGSFFINN